MKYLELGKFGFSFVKGINPVKSKEGEALLIPSGAIFPAGVNYSKTHKIIPDPLDKNKVLKESDILFNTGGEGTIGRCSLFKLQNTECYADGFVVRLRDEKRIAIPDYVFHALCYSDTLNQINNLKDGTTGITSIKVSNIKKLVLPFFEIAEQQTIASILSKTDEAIAETEKLIAKYNRIKTGLMQDLLTKGVDENGNIRSEETHEFKDSPIGRIPKEWDCFPIGKIFELKSGITPLRSNKRYFALEGYNWVKTLDLNEGHLYETEEKVTDYALKNTSLKLMPINSILVAMYGGWEQIGRTSILKSEAGTNQAITCLFNPNRKMNSDFVQLILQYYRYKWKEVAVSTRKDPNITKSDIENFALVFPKNYDEQSLIAGKIVQIKEFVSNQQEHSNKLRKLKSGLMQALLSGKVRVNAITPNQSAS